jgi:hypothetical protein
MVVAFAGALAVTLVIQATGMGHQSAVDRYRDADSVKIYLLSAQSDTAWTIYIPAKGIPPLDTLGVRWWTGGIEEGMLWTGWHSKGVVDVRRQ